MHIIHHYFYKVPCSLMFGTGHDGWQGVWSKEQMFGKRNYWKHQGSSLVVYFLQDQNGNVFWVVGDGLGTLTSKAF